MDTITIKARSLQVGDTIVDDIEQEDSWYRVDTVNWTGPFVEVEGETVIAPYARRQYNSETDVTIQA